MEITFTWQEMQREYWEANLSGTERIIAFPSQEMIIEVAPKHRLMFSGAEITEMQELLNSGCRRSEVAKLFAVDKALVYSYIKRGVLIWSKPDGNDRRRQQRYRAILDLWNEGYSKDMILKKGYTDHEVQQTLYVHHKDERISTKEHDKKKKELRAELIRIGAEDELSLRSTKTLSALGRRTHIGARLGQD